MLDAVTREKLDGHSWLARNEWRRHGMTVIPCIAGVMLIAVHGYLLGVMMPSLEQEFGWSRAQISGGMLFPAFGSLVLAPLVGRAVDRIGARPIALAGVPVYCGALACLSLATASIWSWWILCALVGTASMLIFPNVWAASITNGFVRNRGLALALALSGTGLASAFLPAIAAGLLPEIGWRGSYVAIAAGCFAIIFPLVMFLMRAEERPSAPIGSNEDFDNNQHYKDMRSAQFLKLACAVILYASSACVITMNAVPILLGEGFSLILASQIAGLVGIGTIIGRLGGGFLLDRIDARYVAAGTCVLPMVGIVVLLLSQNSPTAAIFACLSMGIAGGAEYDASAYLAGRYFGKRSFSFLFGSLSSLTLVSAAISPVLANHAYDLTGSYDLVLLVIIPTLFASGLLFLFLGEYPAMPDEEN